MANRTVSVALVADVGQYQSAMVRAAATTKSVGDSATVAGTKAQRGFEAAGRGAALLGAVAAGGLVLGLKGAVNAASEAEQSIGGVEAVFKTYATSVIASSKEADRALGLSANSYRELATIIGSQMKNAGVPLDQLADKTDGIIGIGADLAAQFGGSTQEAVNALSSAFRGELDPIERYGISLTAAAVGAKAVQMGLSESETGLSQNAKAMATLAIITEQSADAQGAFGREADTAAGRSQRAAASWENLKVAVGDRLLPAWSALVDVLGTKVIPALGDVLDVGGDVVSFIGDLGGWAADNTPIVAALASILAIQLAGGITAVTVAANRMVLTPLVLGLSSLLGVAGSLPAAFAAARTAIAGFVAAAAPLIAIGALVGAVTAIWDIATAGSRASEEVAGMWSAVENAGSGTGQVEALESHIAQLRIGIAELQATLADDGAWETTILGAWLTGAVEDQATLDAYTAALKRAEEAQGMVEASASVMSRRFGLTRDQVLDLASKYDIDLTGSMSNTFRLMQNYYAMEFGAKPTEATIAVSNAFEDAKTAVDEAKQAVDGFKLSLDILTGAHVSMIQVESAFQAAVAAADGALDDLNGTVLDGSGNLNLQSEAGRQAADVLLGVRDSGNQLIATLIQQGGTADEVRAKDAQLRQSFIDTAREMGISEDAAWALADQILGIPAERETKINADVQAALDKIDQLQRDIDNLKGRTVEIQVRAAGRFIVNPNGGLQEFGDGPGIGDGPGAAHALPTARAPRGEIGDGPGTVPLNVLHDTRALERTMDEFATQIKSAAPAVGSGGGWQGMWAAVQSAFGGGVNLHSALRPGSITATGNRSYHALGRAIDITPSMGIFNWLASNYPNSRELIYSPAGGRQIWNGRNHMYGEPTRGDHWDHIHWAMANGGIIGEPVVGRGLHTGASYSFGERGPETVLPGIRSREFSGGGSGAAVATPVNLSLAGATITGRFEFGSDGMVTLVDGRIDQALGGLADGMSARGVHV